MTAVSHDAGDYNGSTADGNHDPGNYASLTDAVGPYPPTYFFFQFSTFLYSGRKSIRYRFKLCWFEEKMELSRLYLIFLEKVGYFYVVIVLAKEKVVVVVILRRFV